MTPKDIRQIRKKLGLTQVQFAQVCNTDRGTILKWESTSLNHRTPNGAAVRLIQLLNDLNEKGLFKRIMRPYMGGK